MVGETCPDGVLYMLALGELTRVPLGRSGDACSYGRGRVRRGFRGEGVVLAQASAALAGCLRVSLRSERPDGAAARSADTRRGPSRTFAHAAAMWGP